MRILLVNAHGADRSYGGAERYVHDLRVGLRDHLPHLVRASHHFQNATKLREVREQI